MSADNYYLIRRHPDGGYTPVMGFASSEDIRPATSDDPSYPTVQEAMMSVADEYTEYGIDVEAGLENSAINPLKTPDKIAIAGDWHGNTAWAIRMISIAAESFHVDTLLHVGDFGFWPGHRDNEEYLDQVDTALADAGNMILLWIDGNHENHHALAALPLDEHGLRPIRPHIWHMPRGFRWTWLGKTWMGLGGAYSVDRKFRTPGRDWFPEEALTMTDVRHASEGGPVDVMITHDCPEGVDIPTLRKTAAEGWPATDINSSENNRHALRLVCDAVTPKLLFHGHYHECYRGDLDGDGYRTDIQGLNCDGAFTAWENLWVGSLWEMLND